MFDAFNQSLKVGDLVIGISNLNTTQTLYRGKIVEFVRDCAVVEIVEHAIADQEEAGLAIGQEKRVCVSHRMAKI